MIAQRRIAFAFTTVVVGIVLSLVVGEVFVRVVSPQPYMFPRYRFSSQYGHLLFENEQIVDAMPGVFEYRYTINERGYRGQMLSKEQMEGRLRVVVLGDSYSFGKGVNDNEEYPAVMNALAGETIFVTNLSVIGFGLTQQIRTFYEIALPYEPEVVLLQFCKNDPNDNIINPVVTTDGEKFWFVDTKNSFSLRVQTYISHSPIQLSQLYNFIRLRVLIPLFSLLSTNGDTEGMSEDGSRFSSLRQQKYYNELLHAFAKDLKRRSIHLMMISVNGELQQFSSIWQEVERLDSLRLLEYVEVQPWFADRQDYGSAEGHVWGTVGHRIMAENLVKRLARSSDGTRPKDNRSQ